MTSKRILILGNLSRDDVAQQVGELEKWIAQRCKLIAVLPADEPLSDSLGELDLCVVCGGDGTILAAARLLAGTNVPIMGVNMGKLGFLAEYTVEHMQKHFEDVLTDKIQPTERIMLDVTINNCTQHAFTSKAANDVAIAAGSPFRMIDLHVSRGDESIARYVGDGLVVSTPTGSTAYNMSAGGPLIEPMLDAVAITPIAPHSLTLRPILVHAAKPIKIEMVRINKGTEVIIDGQVHSSLCEGDTVEIRRADKPMRVIPHPGRGFFKVLSEKLKWGISPHHTSGD